MSLIRLIQESGAIKDGLIFSIKTFEYEMESMKQIIKEKDVVIDNNNEKILELENHIFELKEQCASLYEKSKIKIPEPTSEQEELQKKLDKLEEYSQMPGIISNYETFISEITANFEVMKEERNMASSHLATLEFGFADLVEKYERLKTIVIGYQANQETLINQIENYQQVVKLLQDRYDNFKKYANEKLNEANMHVEKKDKKHISELAKVKSQVLQSKVKISELEKTISVLSTNSCSGDAGPSKKSVFSPLPNNFTYD